MQFPVYNYFAVSTVVDAFVVVGLFYPKTSQLVLICEMKL